MRRRQTGSCRKNLIRLLIIASLIALCGEKKKRGQKTRGLKASRKTDGWGYTDWGAL